MEDNAIKMKIGKAGEFRVASELLLRGFHPLMSSIDNGIDLVLENGKTIQVKTAKKCNSKSKPNSHRIEVSTKQTNFWFRLGNKKYERELVRKKFISADFLIVWIIPLESFFIIPKEKIREGLTALSITKNSKHISKGNYYQFKDRWDLLEVNK